MPYPASVTGVKGTGRLKEGDELFTLKVPELEGKYRYEKYWFRQLPNGQPVLVMAMAPQNAGATGPGEYGAPAIRQIEYLSNHAQWANYDAAAFCKKTVESNVFAKGDQLTGMYFVGAQFPTAPTNQLSDYVIDADGIVSKDPKPASGIDMKNAQDEQNEWLKKLAAGLSPNAGGTSGTNGSTGATSTQKMVRFGLIGVLVVGVVIFLISSSKKTKK